MRALLVVNTFATSTSESLRDVITAALSSELELDVIHTTGREHAIAIGARASFEGYELVVTLGGDGTINEVANGVLNSDQPAPLLAALPGGNANVFTRNMGYPNEPIDATAHLLKAIREGRQTQVGVGVLETPTVNRYFLFNAGMGVDAAVLARMHERRIDGKKASDLAYTWLAGKELLHWVNRKNPSLTVAGTRAHFALIVNLAPWSYLGNHALNPAPHAKHQTALDLYAPTSVSMATLTRFARAIFTGADLASDPDVLALLDRPEIELSSSEPLWVQVDGEPLVQATTATLRHIPAALTVLG